jgi:hypothetical protein
MISEEHKAIMNERLLEMQTRFQIQAVKIQDSQKTLYQKLHYFEKLKPAQYALIDMSLDQIFDGLATLESSPFKIWDLIEKHYRKNFFENVIIKRYSSLFENKDEVDFVQTMTDIRARVTLEVSNISK